MNLSEKVVLITGVSRKEGIGFGLARQLLRQGAIVIISARDFEKVALLAQALMGDDLHAVAQQLDITEDESVKRAYDFVEKNWGRLDVLINNAGGSFDVLVEPLATDFEFTRKALETNLFGAWRMVKYFRPLLKRSDHPRIINISSGAGSFSDPVFGLGVHPALTTSYGISKLALNGLTVKLARELKADRILVNAIEPGFTATAPGMEDMGARPVNESIEGIIWAALLPDDGPTGGFFRDKKPLSW